MALFGLASRALKSRASRIFVILAVIAGLVPLLNLFKTTLPMPEVKIEVSDHSKAIEGYIEFRSGKISIYSRNPIAKVELTDVGIDGAETILVRLKSGELVGAVVSEDGEWTARRNAVRRIASFFRAEPKSTLKVLRLATKGSYWSFGQLILMSQAGVVPHKFELQCFLGLGCEQYYISVRCCQ